MAATRAELKEMDEKQEAVAALLEEAEDKASAWFSNLLNPASEQLAGAVKVARELFTRWAEVWKPTGKKRWAVQGTDDRGKRYTVADWLEHGDELAEALALDAGLFWESSTYNAVTVPVAETVEDVAEVVEDVAEAVEGAAKKVAAPWPTSWKVGLGVGAAVAGIGVVGYGVRSFRGLLPRGGDT